VITGYPIRPYDTVMQYIAKLVSNGEMDCEYIIAEGEHSQFEIVKHASACGARVFCGSSGVGWMYAMEALTVTPALRIPMVAMVGNRALDDPGAFGVEHNDALAVRDLGWQLVWVDNAQEALDTALIAFKVAEDRRVFLPCAISCDGAFLTHSQGIVKIPSQEKVNQFLPPYDRGDLLLHPDNPITVAPQANEDWLMEIRRQTAAGMERSPGVIREAYTQFAKVFGRDYGNPFFEEYMTDDADVVIVGMGTLSNPVRVAIREMRKEGKKVGFVRVRWFRPFQAEELAKCLSRFKAVGVIDRDFSLGAPHSSGVLATEIRAALYPVANRPPMLAFICGLGGREVTLPDVKNMTDKVYAAAAGKPQPLTQWIGLRE
jgi:pyruvate ferredoxin oxidoreductase alpha subunit